MHKKPVLQGVSREPQRGGSAAGLGAVLGRAPTRAARLVALLAGLGCALGSATPQPWGVHAAYAEGDPITPASEPSSEAPPPVAPTPASPAPLASDAAKAALLPPAAVAPSGPSGPSAPSAPLSAAPASPPAGQEEKFRDLERRTFELKDQVFRAKARLTLLSETLVSANVGTTRAVIVHKNQMSRLFQPIRVSYQLDGREVFTKEDAAGVAMDGKDLVVWDGGLKAGEHTVGVTVVYRGNGAKVLSYYDKYNFTARAAHRLTAVEGQTTRLLVRCFEKGTALTAKVEDRPDFDFKIAGSGAAARPASADKAAEAKPAEAKAK